MRVLLTSALCCLAATSLSQTQGTYQPAGGQPVAWSINANNTLIWAGSPYLPVGARIEGTPEKVREAKAAGLTDVIVELPAAGNGWKEAIAALEESKLRYLISVNSLAPMARGFAVEPHGYRIDGITSARKIEATIPGSLSVLAILVTKRDSDVQKVFRVPLKDGRLSLDVKPLNDLEHVLLIYPEMRSIQQPDLWDAMDEHRDTLVSSLKRFAPGPGLRGIVNPLGSLTSLAKKEVRFVPNSPYFRYELRAYLENKYKNVDTAVKSWAVSAFDTQDGPNRGFDKLSRLVPLWSGARGIQRLWDPETDQMYMCEGRRSTVWNDIRDVITAAGDRRYRRLSSAVRQAADVPVIQEWAGWAAAYETTQPAVNGIGARVTGSSPAVILESAGRATSSLLRWGQPGWLLATSIDPASAETGLEPLLDDLGSLGMRGCFVANPKAETLKLIAEVGARRASDTLLSTYKPEAVYFPENALNPAVTQRLSGSRWWLPSPANGNRIDFGAGFYGYRYEDGSRKFIALWSTLPQRVKLRAANPKVITFQSVDGTDLNPRLHKNAVEVNVSQMPILIFGAEEIPVPEPAYQDTMARYAALVKYAEDNKVNVAEDKYFFTDAQSGFERNPGGSFTRMRGLLHRFATRFASYTWLEAEAFRETTFSETVSYPGCSNGTALALDSQMNTAGQTFFAEYNVPVRSFSDQDVWIAARIPAVYRNSVVLMIGSQEFTIEGEGVSHYANGYAWYRLGTTKLAGQMVKLRIEARAPEGAEMAIDTIVLTPLSFRPNNVDFPDPIDYSKYIKAR